VGKNNRLKNANLGGGFLVINKQGEVVFADYQYFRYVFYRKGDVLYGVLFREHFPTQSHWKFSTTENLEI